MFTEVKKRMHLPRAQVRSPGRGGLHCCSSHTDGSSHTLTLPLHCLNCTHTLQSLPHVIVIEMGQTCQSQRHNANLMHIFIIINLKEGVLLCVTDPGGSQGEAHFLFSKPINLIYHSKWNFKPHQSNISLQMELFDIVVQQETFWRLSIFSPSHS